MIQSGWMCCYHGTHYTLHTSLPMQIINPAPFDVVFLCFMFIRLERQQQQRGQRQQCRSCWPSWLCGCHRKFLCFRTVNPLNYHQPLLHVDSSMLNNSTLIMHISHGSKRLKYHFITSCHEYIYNTAHYPYTAQHTNYMYIVHLMTC